MTTDNPNVIKLIKELKLDQVKKCKCCGKEHHVIQEGVQCKLGLIWWNCECNTTLIVRKAA